MHARTHDGGGAGRSGAGRGETAPPRARRQHAARRHQTRSRADRPTARAEQRGPCGRPRGGRCVQGVCGMRACVVIKEDPPARHAGQTALRRSSRITAVAVIARAPPTVCRPSSAPAPAPGRPPMHPHRPPPPRAAPACRAVICPCRAPRAAMPPCRRWHPLARSDVQAQGTGHRTRLGHACPRPLPPCTGRCACRAACRMPCRRAAAPQGDCERAPSRPARPVGSPCCAVVRCAVHWRCALALCSLQVGGRRSAAR